MKVKKLLEDEKGAALPFVTIILGLFALGFIALVVDVGTLYVQRKAMVTSADAAALAGAQVLREGKGENVSEAETTARNYAIANGADLSQVQVSVGPKLVTITNGETETRQVVEVTVGKNEPLIFARFLGDENADVKAHAIATWGYVYKSYIGAFPLFVFDITAETDGKIKQGTDIFLHDKYDSSNNSYGLVSMESGKSSIKAAIAGEDAGITYVDGDGDTVILNGEPGQATSIGDSVEARMRLAQSKPTAIERRETMIVLVPVINHADFLLIEANDSGNANKYQLPVKYFAYFEIKDLIKKNGSIGSNEALDPNNGYNKVSSPIDYSGLLAGEDADSSFIYGQFTGETVEARVVVEKGDQNNPDNGGSAPATYSKLIK